MSVGEGDDHGRMQFYHREIKRLIIKEYADEPWFVLKDPRICRFPALYLKVFQKLGIEVLAVLTLGHATNDRQS